MSTYSGNEQGLRRPHIAAGPNDDQQPGRRGLAGPPPAPHRPPPGEILQAAARVFAERGYASATTRQIGQAADVAEGTLYNYFASKRDLLMAIAEETAAPMERALATAGPIRDRQAFSVTAELRRHWDALLSARSNAVQEGLLFQAPLVTILRQPNCWLKLSQRAAERRQAGESRHSRECDRPSRSQTLPGAGYPAHH